MAEPGPPSPAAPPRPWRALALTGLAVAASAALYRGVLTGGFVFDDLPLLVHNDCHRGLDRLPALFDFASKTTCTLRPVRFASFSLDHALFGQDPLGFHLSNVLLHGLVASLGGHLIARWTRRGALGLLAGALFLCHPIATEAVAYISGRRDLLMALFTLLAVAAWLGHRDRPRAWRLPLVFGACLAGLWSHESAAAIPAVLLGLELFGPPRPAARARALALGGLFLAVGLYAAWAIQAHNPSTQQGLWGGSLQTHVATALHGQLHYVRQLLLPLWLQADYTPDAFPIAASLAEPGPLLGLLGVLTAALVAWHQRRRRPNLALALWTYAALLAPASQLVPHHELLAEHRLYLASLVFCGLVAAGLLALAEALGRPRLAPVAAAGLAITWATLTQVRALDWRSEEALWSATLEVAPRAARAHLNLGALRAEAGRDAEAFAHLTVALDIRPDLCAGWFNRASLQRRAGRLEAALQDYQRAYACDPKPRWRPAVSQALLDTCALHEAAALLDLNDPAQAARLSRAAARCGPL